MKPLPQLIADFNEGLAGMTQEQRDAALGTIFTNAGVRAMLPLLASGEEGWYGMAQATEEATGIQEQAAIKANTTAGRLEALEGNVETLKIEIGEQLLPYLYDFVEWLIPFIDRYGPFVVRAFGNMVEQGENLFKAFKPLEEPITLLMEAFSGLLAALGIEEGEAAGWFGEFVNTLVLTQVTTWVANLTTAIENITTALEIASSVIEWFKGAWDKLSNITLPDWMTPGSPTPFELGIRGITDAMTELDRMGMPSLQAAFAGMGNSTQQTTNHNYYLTAQYQNQQSMGTLADDVRALSILTAGA